MYVIDVVPFSRTAPANTLSYRSKTSIKEGVVVSVPLRNRTVNAVVIKCTPVADVKTLLKQSSFIPRSVIEHSVAELPKIYYATALNTAHRHTASIGKTLRQLFTNDSIEAGFHTDLISKNKFSYKQYEAPYKDRAHKYKTLSEKEEDTILYVVPSATEAVRLATYMPSTTVVISGNQRSSKRKEMINKAFDAHVVIVTVPYAFVPIHKLSMIVIERESAEAFTNIQYPYIDMRIALYELAKTRGITILIGDYPIRLETRTPHGKSLPNVFHEKIQVLSTRTNDLYIPEQKYTTLPIPIRDTIKQTLSKGERVLLMTVRRGYSSTVVCKDCGESIHDKNGNALSLATKNGKRIFRSTDGTAIYNADIRCKNCDSWNLIPIGVGIERVEEDVKRYFTNTPYVRFDSDTITTAKLATHALEKMRTQGGILLATEKIIPWLEQEDLFSTVIIVSADSLLSIPFWRARERFVRIVFSLAQHAQHLIIGTRRPKDTVCQALAQPTMKLFIDEELQLRKTLHYPPYGYILLFRIVGNETYLETGEKLICNILNTLTPISMPDKLIANKRIRILIYKLQHLPSIEISKRIACLPHYITHTINGESLN